MLADVRRDLTDQLTAAGLDAFAYLPERIQPPCVLIAPGEPYLAVGPTYCDFTVNLVATLVAGKATNAIETDDLDRLIETAILATDDFTVAAVAAPISLEVNNATYLAVRMNLSTEANI